MLMLTDADNDAMTVLMLILAWTMCSESQFSSMRLRGANITRSAGSSQDVDADIDAQLIALMMLMLS